jgi:UDP-N-acetylmuramoyl-tripeptide--D-alanyl-D-alanine ligase
LLGAHNVYPALAAAAVASEEGLSLSETAEALLHLSPALRLLVIDGINGSRILDDSYNANPESVVAALKLLSELPGQRKIAVLGDMLELGSAEEASHRRVGRTAAAVLDLLITYGPRSQATIDEAVQAGLRDDHAVRFDTREAIVDFLRDRLRRDDDVLVKGSLAMGMSAVVHGIQA